MNLTNNRFGVLNVVKDSGQRNSGRSILWECLCDCGNKVHRPTSELVKNRAISCGCIRRRPSYSSTTITRTNSNNIDKASTKISNPKTKHPGAYWSWKGAKDRATKRAEYIERGGMCKGLLNSFELFLSILGDRPLDTTLDRSDNELGYFCGQCEDCITNSYPLNIRWASKYQQANNTRTNKYMIHKGALITLRQYCIDNNLDNREFFYLHNLRKKYNLHTIEELLNKKEEIRQLKVSKHPTITIDGDTRTINEWSDHFNIDRELVRSRYLRGITNPEELYKPKRSESSITIEGTTHTLKEWAHITGIKYDTIHGRYHKGLPAEQVLKEYMDHYV